MPRIRHCVECPICLTRYLISFSPYRNGSYLIAAVEGYFDEYVLYCACRRAPVGTVCRCNDLKSYEVSNAAYYRGYGTAEEIVPIRNRGRKSAMNPGRKLESNRRATAEEHSP